MNVKALIDKWTMLLKNLAKRKGSEFWDEFRKNAAQDIGRVWQQRSRRTFKIVAGIVVGTLVLTIYTRFNVTQHHTVETGLSSPTSTSPVNSLSTTTSSTETVPLAGMIPPTFHYVQGSNGLSAPDGANQVATMFAWLDGQSGPNVDTSTILGEIRLITTNHFYVSLAQSFQLPTESQTWIDITAKPLKHSSNEWTIQTISRVESSSGQTVQLSLVEQVVKEYGQWKVAKAMPVSLSS